MTANEDQPQEQLNTAVPHSARVWNYWLGGKDNFASDRAVGDQVSAIYPHVATIARESRRFLVRAVRHLAGDAGIRQFLDVGTGLPTANNTHEVAQAIAADSRIVYVDNDPLVLTHARALLTSTTEGATAYIDADVRDPGRILREAADTLDFTRPVAVTLLGILGNVADTAEAQSIVDEFMAAVPSGSYLVINDGTDTDRAAVDAANARGEAGDPYYLRSPDTITGFFRGLQLVDPGVVPTPLWRSEPDDVTDADLAVYCGVARKP